MGLDKETEIDLWELLLNGYRFFKRKIKIILTFLLIGLLFGIGSFFTHPLEYKSFYRKEFIAQSSVTTNEILSDIINAVPVNIKNEKENSFPEFRNIKWKTEANNNKETRLKITIEAFTPESIDSLLKSLTIYINSIEAFSKKFNLQQQQQRKLLTVLNKQIAEADTTTKNTKRFNPIELVEKKQKIEKDLALNKIVDFIPVYPDCISISNRRAGILNVLGYSFLGLVLGAIIAWLLDFFNHEK